MMPASNCWRQGIALAFKNHLYACLLSRGGKMFSQRAMNCYLEPSTSSSKQLPSGQPHKIMDTMNLGIT